MDDDNFVLHGTTTSEPFPEGTLGQIIYDSLTKSTAKHDAFVDVESGKGIPYKTLLEKSCSLAQALANCDCPQGTRIAVSSENCLEFFVPVVASLYLGCTVVPVNPIYTPQELKHLLGITRPKVVFCSRKVVHKFVRLRNEMDFIEKLVVIDSAERAEEAENLEEFTRNNVGGNVIPLDRFRPLNADPSKLTAFILSSSGTTGLPKGVMISHRNVATKIAHARDPLFKYDYPNLMGLVPFFHGYGLNLGLCSIVTGHRIIFLRRFEEDLFLKTIQDYKVSVLPIAPPTAVFLSKTSKFSKYNLSSVKSIHCGAAPLSKYTEECLKTRFNLQGITQGYGLTEAYEGIAKMPKDQNRPGSCGQLMAFVTCKIRDHESGRSLGPRQVGEICLKGPMVMQGYLTNPEATKEAFTGNGWLRTGDLAYYDEEKYLYIVDRLKELIKYKGFQVAPAELESILIKHPQVVDVAVVGLPNEQSGELPLAYVVKREGSLVTEKELQDFVASQVSPQKKLRGGVIFIQSIPKNPSGKKLRKVLREEAKLLGKLQKSKL